MTQEQLDAEKPIKHPNEKGLPPGAKSVRVAADDMTYDESMLFGDLSDDDDDGEGRESGLGNRIYSASLQIFLFILFSVVPDEILSFLIIEKPQSESSILDSSRGNAGQENR